MRSPCRILFSFGGGSEFGLALTGFSLAQILIHRPFLPKPGRPVSQLGVASLAICTNAARSASHVADAHLSRGLIASQHMQLATFTAAIVLLIGVWGQKKTGGIGNPTVALADVQKCLKSLKVSEGRWRQAGKLRLVRIPLPIPFRLIFTFYVLP